MELEEREDIRKQLCVDLKTLLEGNADLFADVVFECEGHKIGAHSNLL
jgi:hypothetical protein